MCMMTVNVTLADEYDASANIGFMKIQSEIMIKNSPSMILKSRQLLV